MAPLERMLGPNNQEHSRRLAPSGLDRVEREIAATDVAIDELVYKPYGITEDHRGEYRRRRGDRRG